MAHTDAAAAAPRDTLYYDGLCPLCNAEMDKLRAARGDALHLQDIHALGDGSRDEPHAASNAHTALPDRETLLKTLHLRRADGRWLTGADANVAAWEGTTQARWLRVLRWPLLRYGVDLGYALWARWRYSRLYGKRGTVCRAPRQS